VQLDRPPPRVAPATTLDGRHAVEDGLDEHAVVPVGAGDRDGFHNFTSYSIRILLAADGTRPHQRPPTKSRSAERADPG
jgi:hypothetical protein